MIGPSISGRIQSTVPLWRECPCKKSTGEYNNGTVTVRYADYYGMAGTRNLARLLTNEMNEMSDLEAAKLFADIIYKAPGSVERENISDALGNVCRFLEGPCDPRLGLHPGALGKLGRVLDQMKRNDRLNYAYELLLQAYIFRPGMVEKLNTLISEAQQNALERGRLNNR